MSQKEISEVRSQIFETVYIEDIFKKKKRNNQQTDTLEKNVSNAVDLDWLMSVKSLG